MVAAQNNKNLLIVDDSETDRTLLKNILAEGFDLMETDNGYQAIEIMSDKKNKLDALILDISMPLMNGFDVLRLMKENGIENIPVFIITAEATEENVLQAAELGVSEFIIKPFDGDEILRRIKSKLGIVTEYWLSVADILETNKYISELKALYQMYLSNHGRNDTHYTNMAELMNIILTRYSRNNPHLELNKEKIDIISNAAYFCDIGEMLIPDKMSLISKNPTMAEVMLQNHTKMGANVIRLNHSKHCEYFVQICSDMCIYHHERYDGTGYPHRLAGNNISIYNQICKLVDDFDALLSKFYGADGMQVNFIMKRMLNDQGLVSEEVFSLLEECKPTITNYYAKLAKDKAGGGDD